MEYSTIGVDNESFEISEKFVGFNQLAPIKSDVIFEMLRLELLRLNLSVTK